MSTHTFTHGDLRVQTGWDRPLQYFYLVIERHDPVLGRTLVYCNLDDHQSATGGLTLTQIEARLAERNVPVPAGLMDALQEDQAVNRGNHHVDWTAAALA